MENALDMWQSIKAKIDGGEDPKNLPTTVDIPAFYNIKYKTFCHHINGMTAAKGHASGGARRGWVFTVVTCGNSYERAHQSLYFKHTFMGIHRIQFQILQPLVYQFILKPQVLQVSINHIIHSVFHNGISYPLMNTRLLSALTS